MKDELLKAIAENGNSRIDRLEETCRELKKDMALVKHDNDQLRYKITELRRLVKERDGEIASLFKEKQNLLSENDELTEELVELAQQVEALEAAKSKGSGNEGAEVDKTQN